jgi:hypothetical protein
LHRLVFGAVALRDQRTGPRLRARLADVLQAAHLRGEVHITARELRAALAFIFFGVHDCGELHAEPEWTPPRYWDRAFAADAPQRQGELLAELARFDPALDSNPVTGPAPAQGHPARPGRHRRRAGLRSPPRVVRVG